MGETEISLSYPPAHSQYPRYPDPTTALLSSTVHQSCATRQPSCCSPKVSCIHFKTQFQIHPYSIRASKRTSDFEASNLCVEGALRRERLSVLSFPRKFFSSSFHPFCCLLKSSIPAQLHSPLHLLQTFDLPIISTSHTRLIHNGRTHVRP